MGFFNIFKKPAKIYDEFFGTLTFMEIKNNPSNNYFEGKGVFNPTNEQIEYFISADLTGPTDEQKDFYKKVEASFEDLISKSKPLIEEEFRNWKDNFKIKDFKSEFKLVAISIPRLQNHPLIWDMSFEIIDDDNHHITINFINFETDGILIDE